MPHIELYTERSYIYPHLANGISVYFDIEDILRIKKRVPALRKKLIAAGVLPPERGKILHTPSPEAESCHTWWIPKGCQPWKFFHVVHIL
jgi:hypothetical protein